MADIATWGVGNELTYGIVQNDSINETHKTGECRNEKGQVVRVQQYDKEYSGSYTLVVTSEASFPEVGDAIKIDSTDMYITNIELIENNTSFKSARISCRASHKVKTITEVE